MSQQEDKKKGMGNQVLNQLRDNADWQVGLVVIIALAALAIKLFMGW